jgi:uncharacterized protein (DUF697 family)
VPQMLPAVIANPASVGPAGQWICAVAEESRQGAELVALLGPVAKVDLCGVGRKAVTTVLPRPESLVAATAVYTIVYTMLKPLLASYMSTSTMTTADGVTR